MCLPIASNKRLLALASSLFAPLMGGGCARPAGPLFAPVAKERVWPPPPEQARIRYVGALRNSGDLSAPQTGGEALGAALRGPRRPIGFSAPHSVARSGNLLAVADVGLAGVHVIDLSARTHLLITGWREGEIEERLAAPIGVCLAGARVFVTDAKRGEVLEFDTAGGFRRRFGAEELARPVGVVYVRTCEQLYVVDGGAHCVVVFAMNGEAVARIGEPGNAPGAFNLPTHIAWDGANRLAVADSANFRVQLLDLDGAGAVTIGKKGDAAGDFALPKGVAFDSAGHLYTVDAQFENVQVFDQRGQLLLAFGREGGDAGEFALPAGLAIDDRDRVWIADSANHRIQVFDYLGDVP